MKTKTISTRFEPERAYLLLKVCEERGECASDFIRRATLKELARLSFLPPESKKALGLPTESFESGSGS